MRIFVRVACLATMLLLALPCGFAKTPPAGQGKIVIVFRDGHSQSFNLNDIARVEFPAPSETGSVNAEPWPRSRFLGKWEVGTGGGGNFFITLYDDGDAKRSLGDVRGKWVYVDGEARIAWDDGAQDAIRKNGSQYRKFAYKAGKSFTDAPDNVTAAHNTTHKPI